MDIKIADQNLTNKITKFIQNKEPENGFLDYKARWESKNSELIKDIFSFVNTVNNKDCYLIYGVTDKTQKVVGVEGDAHRKDQEMIIDLLSKLPIAGGYIPPIKVNTLKLKGKQVDVLTIQNTNNVPIYLSKRCHFKKDRPIYPGLIYSRIEDRDTGQDQTTNFVRTKNLWRKHFGLGLPIRKRYLKVLKDIPNWVYHDELLPGSCPCFIYKLNPNFRINLVNDNNANRKVSPISLLMFLRPKIDGFVYLDLEYNNNTICAPCGMYLDGCRILIVLPQFNFIYDDYGVFYYFIKNSLRYSLYKMVFINYIKFFFHNLHEDEHYIYEYQRIFNKAFIYFKSDNEMKSFHKQLFNNKHSLIKRVNNKLTFNDRKYIKRILKSINTDYRRSIKSLQKQYWIMRIIRQFYDEVMS